jgi:hypothetical protein
MQFVWFLARGTRVGRPQREIMLWELPSELEVGPLIAMPLVRGRGTVLGTHRPPSGPGPGSGWRSTPTGARHWRWAGSVERVFRCTRTPRESLAGGPGGRLRPWTAMRS